MSGRRARAIRAAFLRGRGRAPSKTRFEGGREAETYKAAKRVEAKGFLARIADALGRVLKGSSRRDMRDAKLGWVRRYFVGSYQPSEWRRVKKAARPRPALPDLQARIDAEDAARARKRKARAKRSRAAVKNGNGWMRLLREERAS